MNSSRTAGNIVGILEIAALLIAGATTTGIAENARSGAIRNLLLWDTLSPVGDRLKPDDWSGWKAVPNDLLLLEKDPVKASSDPGYYGRDYAFAGDAVVETPLLTAVFGSAKGRVTIYSKRDSFLKEKGTEAAGWIDGKIVDVSPIRAEDGATRISNVEVLRNADDEIVLKVCFSPPGSPQVAGTFSFDRTGTVEIKPGEHMKRVRLSSPIDYGLVPSFVGDDLVFGAGERSAANLSGRADPGAVPTNPAEPGWL